MNTDSLKALSLRWVFCFCLLLAPNFACLPAGSKRPDANSSAPVAFPKLDAKSYPRVNGSSSTFPLAQLVLARALEVKGELRRGAPVYNQIVAPLEFSFAPDTPAQKRARYETLKKANAHLGTHESYESLIHGRADLILVAREPSKDETELAAQNKVALKASPVARDALVFIVNKKNTVNNLTRVQLRNIFSGQTLNWKSVGGADEPIRPYTRDRNSGSEELARALLMKNTPMIEGGDRIISSMAGLLDAIARNPRGIGYSIFYFESVMNPRAENKTLAVEGVLPTRDSIADETYPLTAPVYIVTREDIKPDSPAVLLRDWLLSPDGQRLVAQSGFVPLS